MWKPNSSKTSRSVLIWPSIKPLAMRYTLPANKEHGEASGTNGGTMGRNYSDYNEHQQRSRLLTWAHDYGKHHVDALIGHEFNWNRTYYD